MKKVFWILLIALFAFGYSNREALSDYSQKALYKSACDAPITYRIGTIDPEFNVTTQTLLSNVEEAGAIWSNAYGEQLFAYDPEGEVMINLIYDERQLLNTQVNQLNNRVKEAQKNLDPEIADYQRRAGEFQAKMAALNNDIDYWNNQGGAPPAEYEKLKNRQEALNREANSLQQEAESLNQSTDEYNTQVGELRQTVDNFNQTLTFKPEEGEYIVENGEQKINIYFSDSQSKLVHTLAHELGHALSITHNDNTSSIMYPRTTDALTLSSDDLAGLQNACAEKNVLQDVGNNFVLFINQLEHGFR